MTPVVLLIERPAGRPAACQFTYGGVPPVPTSATE
jgi:hypothetical protein